MNKLKHGYKLTLALLLITLLSACGGEYHSEHEHYRDPVYVDYYPTLYSFDMIDTYGTHSAYEDIHLALSPYVNGGLFEVEWDVNYSDDYYIDLRINDINSIHGSRVITSEYCDPIFPCDRDQYQFCEYTPDFYVGCENSVGNYQEDYIGDMIHSIPQDLYFVLQVCDSQRFHCEYETLPVSME